VKRRIQCRIASEQAGIPLLDFLASRFPYHARDEWAARVAEGLAQVNGAVVGTEHVLASDDVLEYIAHDATEPMVDMNLQVIHEDGDIMVIDKPPNLPCHPAGSYFNHTLWAELRRRFGIESPAFVNRLDRETSGLVVVAKNDRAAKSCRTQFARRRVKKGYVVLVEGRFPDTLEACGNLVPDPAFGIHKRRLFLPESEVAATPMSERDPPKGPRRSSGGWSTTRGSVWLRRFPIPDGSTRFAPRFIPSGFPL